VSGIRTARAAAGAMAVAAACAACGGAASRAAPIVDPPDGVSVAVYFGAGQGHAAIDDRRTIEVTGRRVLLHGIAPGVALASLAIEPLGAARGVLAIDQCAREELRLEPPPAGDGDVVASPVLACNVTGPPGRHRVRVHYVTASHGLQIRHEIAMTAPDRATISTRFTLPTPALGARGEAAFHDGVPGTGDPPREVARGPVTLDGGIAVIATPPREVPARLVRVYDGMIRSIVGPEPTDAGWGNGSHHAVRVMLELGGPPLLWARAHVRISLDGGDTYEVSTAYHPEEDERWGLPLEEGKMATSAPAAATPRLPRRAVAGHAAGTRGARGASGGAASARRAGAASGSAAAAGEPVRLPLWTEPLLRGTRKRMADRTGRADRVGRTGRAGRAGRTDGGSLAERVELTVSNLGTEPREVWIEEPLRPARRRELVRGREGSTVQPEIAGDVARAKVVVGPGRIERVGFTVRYTF
jgi:hypothetical protein